VKDGATTPKIARTTTPEILRPCRTGKLVQMVSTAQPIACSVTQLLALAVMAGDQASAWRSFQIVMTRSARLTFLNRSILRRQGGQHAGRLRLADVVLLDPVIGDAVGPVVPELDALAHLVRHQVVQPQQVLDDRVVQLLHLLRGRAPEVAALERASLCQLHSATIRPARA